MCATGTSAARRCFFSITHCYLMHRCNKPIEEVKDVYITIQKETDAGMDVSRPGYEFRADQLQLLGQNMSVEMTRAWW